MEQSQAGRETSVLLQHLIKSLLTVSSQTFHIFDTFLSPSEFPSMSHQRKNEQTISQYHSLCKTTPSRYTKKGGALLKNFLKHSKGLRRKREEPSSSRNWFIGIVFGGESPPPLSICSTPHIHASSTNIMFTSIPEKKKKVRRECTSTLLSPSFYTALTLMKYPDSGFLEQGPWTRNTFLKKAMLLLRTQPTHKQNTRKRPNQTSSARKHSKRNCDR